MTDKPQNLPESTVHRALAEAAQEAAAQGDPMTTGTYRVEASVKQNAEHICGMHGTSLSAFLRKCCQILERDYLPEPAKRE